MNCRKHISTIVAVAAVCCLGLSMLLAVGCKKETEEPTPGGAESATLRAEISQQADRFVNICCPIMGSKIDLANVSESLTRTHKGRKVALCCAGCPAAWDKLSEAEKDAKLAKVVAEKSD